MKDLPSWQDGFQFTHNSPRKNGEMKRFHGLDRARGYGLKALVCRIN